MQVTQNLIRQGRREQIENLKGDDTLGEDQGDIIMYWGFVNGEKAVITHRIREVRTIVVDGTSAVAIYTRGDAEADIETNLINVSYDNIIATYKGRVVGMGTIVYGLQSNTTLMFCVIVLPLIALFIWNGFSFVKLIFVQKKETAIEEITMQHEEEKARILEEAKRLALEELKREMAEKDKKSE